MARPEVPGEAPTGPVARLVAMLASSPSRGQARSTYLTAAGLAAVLVAAVLWLAGGNSDADPSVHQPHAPVVEVAAPGVASPEAAPDRAAVAVVAPTALAGASAETIAVVDGEPVLVEQLPSELQKPLREALHACAHACEMLSLPVPDWSTARIAPADARALIAREAELRRRILDSALASQRELGARVAADPNLGLRIPAAERAQLEARMKERYPGWPDGYVFFEESDGGEARIAAFRVADDPVLSALMRDHDALTGDYARAVRSGYRSVLRP